jgi:hypothetical protein
MNRPPPPPPSQQRAAPAQQRAAPAPGATRTGSAPAAPTPAVSAVPLQTPQNLGIDPVAADTNDPRLGFEWKSRAIGSNHTWGCVVSAGQGEALSVRVTQLPYDRTLRGVGSVELTAIPVAAAGTRGTFTARNESTGAVAEFGWTWSPFEPRHAAARSKTAPAGAAAPAPAKRAFATTVPAEALREAMALQAQAGGVSAQKAFFGMQASGRRIAFVLDMSGSMVGSRWQKCTQELAGILWGLDPGFQFYVVLFSDRLEVPPGQEGWTQADPERKAVVLSWLAGITPSGGTYPRPAFERLYSLSVRPTTVFFLTDGQFFGGFTAEDCARLQNTPPPTEEGGLLSRLRDRLFGRDEAPQGEKAVINTITLDDAASAPVMQQISAESGGQYTHAKST